MRQWRMRLACGAGLVASVVALGPSVLPAAAEALPPPPTVTGVSPGAGSTSPFDTVTITGTDFAAGDTVSFGSSAATSVTVVSPTMITALPPAAAATSTVDVTVTDASGQTSAASSADEYIYVSCRYDGPPEVPLVYVIAPGPLTLDALMWTAPANCMPANATVQWEVGTYGDLNGSGPFTPIPGATSQTLTLPTISFAQNGIPYEAIFSVGSTRVGSTYFVVSVDGVPEITAQPASVTAPVGTTATFTAAANTGPGGGSVQWQSEAPGATTYTPIAGATSDTLSVPGVTLAQSGTRYEAVYTDDIGSTTTNPATLTVVVPPVVTLIAPSSGGPFSGVLILGRGFNQVRSVRFGTRPAFFLAFTRGLIVAFAPTGGTGTVDVTVTTRTGATSALSSADQFTYR